MNASSTPSAPDPSVRSDDWITFAHELELPIDSGFFSLPPRVTLDSVLDQCEDTLARIPLQDILGQPDRIKQQIEFVL